MKIITLDSQILNSVQLCERRSKYEFIDSIAPITRGESLERGSLLHKMIEVHEQVRCDLVRTNSDTWKQLREIELLPKPGEDLMDYTEKTARFFASKLDLPHEEVEQVIFQFKEYTEYYKDDVWQTLALEAVGSKVLYEDEDYKFIYAFKIDRLAQNGQIVAPWDYKSSKQRKETSSLSNQFMGYAWATETNYVVVDKIGFQKTLKPAERFQRIILAYDNQRLAEWQRNAVKVAFKYAKLLEDPSDTEMDFTSCDKYSGCVFRPICEKSPDARDWLIARDYRIGEHWDPAKLLEIESEAMA